MNAGKVIRMIKEVESLFKKCSMIIWPVWSRKLKKGYHWAINTSRK